MFRLSKHYYWTYIKKRMAVIPPPEMSHPRQVVALRVHRAGFSRVEVTNTVVFKLEMYEV